MAQEIIKAENFFDRRFGVTGRDLEKLLSQALERKADYADLYFEYRVNEGVSLEEGLVKTGSRSTSHGVGVRGVSAAKTGYADNRESPCDGGRAGEKDGAALRDRPARPLARSAREKRLRLVRERGKDRARRVFQRLARRRQPAARALERHLHRPGARQQPGRHI